MIEDMKLYNITDLMPILGLGRRTIQKYIREGRLKAIKAGNQWKVTEAAVKEFSTGGTTK